MPLLDPWSLLDGGGNIVTDPMFADTLNADYSLSANSPCIDAGAYRPDLPEFDIRYHRRVSPGTINGPRTVDIGAYEYSSVYIGGINGYVYDSVSALPVDCVKIEILGKLPEFSDTLGCFQYPSGAGNYTVKASRWDYQDLIIPNVVVTLGEDTILNIPLVRTNVANDDNTQSPEPTDFGLANYPNPFNPTTTISFIAPQAGTTKLSVFNIKGQRVKMLYNGLLSKGHHSIVWNGLDERGTAVSSGVYFVRVEMNGISQTHKMILMK
ncbi:MAG: T9SS type A sorting domain-containing protein [Candidatus Cloacimonetes bacterium]|nr:T9SS type A sorting domain-containing protein [Candidatus Cloacimonadota bacterium]